MDLIFSNLEPKHITVTESPDPLLEIDLYHPALDIDIYLLEYNIKQDNKTLLSKNTKPIFCFRDGDYVSICETLRNTDWKSEFDKHANSDEATDHFYKHMKGLIEKHIPQKALKDFKFPKWVSSPLKNLILAKKRTHKLLKSYGTQNLRLQFSYLRRECKILASRDYSRFIHETELNLQQNPRKFWYFIKNNKNENYIPESMHLNNSKADNGQDIVELFASNFSAIYSQESLAPPEFNYLKTLQTPLYNLTITEDETLKLLLKSKLDSSSGPDGIPPIVLKKCARAIVQPLVILFNRLLVSGTYPQTWKISYIIPIFKGGRDRSNIAQYRPICKISAIPKLFEHIIYTKLTPILSPLIISNQHGFIKNKSTTSNLVSFIECVNESVKIGRAHV